MLKEKFPKHADGSIDVQAWLDNYFSGYSEQSLTLIRQACDFAHISCHDNATFYGQSCFEQGLEAAEILAELHSDATTIISAIIYCSTQGADISFEDISDHLGEDICALLHGVDNMNAMSSLHQRTNRTSNKQIDNLRKMLLAMVADVRVVLITLVIRVCIMRGIKNLGDLERKQYADETMDVYAPLANRLGIYAIKWQLEDLSFYDTEPATYLVLAKNINEKRIAREQRINKCMTLLREKLQDQRIKAEVTGRVKHIYSIYKKMQRKNVPFDEVYDVHAIRVIVDKEKHCYTALGIVHDIWESIPEEFDDYISTPKPNGYKSIHTAVFGPDNKYLEIQFRTHKMHEDNEMGGAAHWLYKEGTKSQGGYESKISWLRELLEWHKELSHNDEGLDRFHDQVFEDRVYVFTPDGDIVDLPQKATPLDFAYHIHSEVGHRCKGAKVNKKMVPLTHTLTTGDHVEVITAKHPRPSRDWLSPDQGYLASAKARSKVHQWFRLQDIESNIVEGRNLIDKEFERLKLHGINLDKIANEINVKNVDQLFSGLACGNIRISQVIHAAKALYPKQFSAEKETIELKIQTQIKPKKSSSDIYISGISNLLTHTANCCQPIPGDPIIGFITRGRGVSIHRQDCKNISHLSEIEKARLIDANWASQQNNSYIVDLVIYANNPEKVVTTLGALLANDKIKVLQMTHRNGTISTSICIYNISELNHIVDRIKQLPTVTEVKRSSYQGIQ